MSEFRVSIPKLNASIDENEKLIAILDNSMVEMLHIQKGLKMQILQRERINSKLRASVRDLEQKRNAIRRTVEVGRQVVQLYENNERMLIGGIGNSHFEPTPEADLSTIQKTHGDENLDKENNEHKTCFSYVNSLLSLLLGDKKGSEGLSKWCTLVGDSADVWSLLYMLMGGGRTLPGVDYGVAIAGSTAKLAASIIKVLDTKGESAAQTIADIVDCIGQGSEVVNSICNKSEGLITPAGIYATVVKSTTSFISTVIRNVGEYIADGVYDMGEIGATGVNAAVHGLYSMGSDLVSMVTGGAIDLEGIIGVSDDDISNGIRNFGEKWGQSASHYIINNPERMERYQNAGPIQRSVMIWGAILHVGR